MSVMQDFRDGTTFRKNPKRLGADFLNLTAAIGYWLVECGHFGWHLLPQSDTELACDGIALLLLIVTANRLRDRKPKVWRTAAIDPQVWRV